MKVRVLGEQLQLFIKHFQAFLRDVIGRDIVDRNLQPLEPRLVKALNAFCHQQIAVGDQSRDHATLADAVNDVIEFGMQERLAAADRDDRCAQVRELVDPLEHGLDRHGLRKVVVLVAVFAR